MLGNKFKDKYYNWHSFDQWIRPGYKNRITGIITIIKKTVFLLVFIFFSLSTISAQTESFKDEDFYALENAALQKLKDKTYRLIQTFGTYKNGSSSPGKSSKTIREFILPDREHYVSESDSDAGLIRFEFIRIGKNTFYRYGSGEWTREFKPSSGQGNGSGSGGSGDARIGVEEKRERKLSKDQTLNNKKVDLYEIINTSVYHYQARYYAIITRKSSWFDQTGLLVKQVNEYENTEIKEIIRDTEEYEYNPKDLKIEAPIK